MADIGRRSFLAGGSALGLGAAGALVGGRSAEAATTATAPHPNVFPRARATALPRRYQAAAVSAAAAGGTNTTLNGTTGWFVPKDWGASWRAALTRAKGGNGNAVAALVGDSVGHGYWASNLYSTAWTEVLRTQMTNLAGYGGSGFQSQAHSHTVMYNPGSGVPQYYTSVPGNVWQQSSAWQGAGGSNVYGPGLGAIVSTASGATVFNYIIGSSLGVWYYDSGAAFDVAINGKTVGTVTPGTSGVPKLVTYACPGAQDVYGWTITTRGAGTAICGVVGLNGTGVRFDNYSFPGAYSGAVNNLDAMQTGTYCGGWRQPADLVIYQLAGNDLVGGDPAYPKGTPPDTWLANIQTYLEGVMDITFGGTATGKTDLIFLFPVADESKDVYRLADAYKSRALGLAQMYGAALFDLGATFHTSFNAWKVAGYAGNAADPTTAASDPTHPSDAGHALLGNQLAQLLAVLS